MATLPSGVWGIDLGQCALKALRLEIGEDGHVEATAFDYVEHPKILSQPDADPDQLTREALEKFLARNTLRGDQVAISVPGQSGLARFVKLPPVEEKKIGDIVRFEAKQQIPFNLEEVVWDYQKIGSGAVTDGFAMETEIGLFAIKRDMVTRYLQHFKDVNVEVHLVQMAPLALCNFVAYDLLGKTDDPKVEGEAKAPVAGKKQCVVALDIGADSSNLVITDGGRIIWQRPIPLGGNHFTRALTKDMKLTFAKAEHLKRNATKSPDLKQILSSLKPVLNDFVGEVQRSLGYFTNTHRDANILYMIGLGNAFRLPGLQRYLTEKLQLDVRKLQKLERLTGDTVVTAPSYTENVLSYAVAYGLALQGLKLAHLRTNLLPPEIQTDRLIRGKKPFAAAAAAALLLGATGMTLSYSLEARAVGGMNDKDTNNPVRQAMAKSDDVVKTKVGWDRKFDDQKKKADEEEKAVKIIIAGQEERFDWMELNRFINIVLPNPSPDAPNLVSPDARKHYVKDNYDKAMFAFLQYQKRLVSGKTSTVGPEGTAPGGDNDGEDDLIMVNIETVDARFVDDLSATWETIKHQNVDLSEKVRPKSQYKEAPKEKGWVVELRGYTNHKNQANFVLETLVENLADFTQKTPAAASPGDKAPDKAPGKDSAPPTPATPPEENKNQGPILGRISHVTLFRVNPTESAGGFSMPSVLSAITGGAAGATSGSGLQPTSPMPGGLEGGAKGSGAGAAGGSTASSSRNGWKPLGGLGGRSSGQGNYGAGGAGGPGGKSPLMVGGAGVGPNYPAPGSTGYTPSSVGGKNPVQSTTGPAGQHARTEFVVLFFWREPLPSDNLRSMTEGTTPTGTGGGFGPGGFGGAGGYGPTSPGAGAGGAGGLGPVTPKSGGGGG